MIQNKYFLYLIQVLFLISVIGCSSSGSDDNPVDSDDPDTTAPAPVSLFAVSASLSSNDINLSWVNPMDTDFAGVAIVRSITTSPLTISDGVLVYTGVSTSYIDSNLTAGIRYYYSVFSYDRVPNYSAPATGDATPISVVVIPPPLPSARDGHASAVLDGELYVMGGYNSGYLSNVDIYNPITNAWRSGLPILRRTQLTANTANKVIYAITGRTISNAGSIANTNWVEAYNGTTLLWARVANYPVNAWKIDSVAYNNDIYTIGGDVYKYSTANNTWSLLSVATGNYGGDHCSVQINGKIYVSGGTSNTDGLFIYDIAQNIWSAGQLMPIGRFRHACVAYNNKIYVFGGESISTSTVHYLPVSIDIYDPIQDQWTTSASTITSGRQEHTATVLDDYVYLIGGNTETSGSGGIYLNTVEKLSLGDL